MMHKNFPFTAICGQDDFKLALLLCMIDPSLGGVLALGDKGTGKTTTVRALQSLMKNIESDFPFVNLPIGATEDRVLGSVHLETLINEKKLEVQKGLLAKAHQGVLYIDEVNLLNDYLMDVLLDASSSGGYFLERDAISQWLDSRFCLVGTMNPEEGDLRPQLLDRFGLSVTIKTPTDKKIRMKIVNRRLDFDMDSNAFCRQFEDDEKGLSKIIASAKEQLSSIYISEEIKENIADKCISHQVEGLRADILLMKASRAYAALDNCTEVTVMHLEKVAPLVLNHRAKHFPKSNDNGNDNDNGNGNENENENTENIENSGLSDYLLQATETEQFLKIQIPKIESKKGLLFKNQLIQKSSQHPFGTVATGIDVLSSVKEYLTTQKIKVHYKKAIAQSKIHLIFLIDSSSSMVKNQQISFIKGLISETLLQFKNKKIVLSAVALQNGTATVVLKLTQNIEKFIAEIQQLRSGGKTNLKAGLSLVHQLLKLKMPQEETVFYVLTDGKINKGETENPFAEAVSYFKTYLRISKNTTVIDTEKGFVKLALAKKLAIEMNVNYRVVAY
ncbi:VWA domain-containing protein [Flavobacterium sp. ZT3R18]|uniref:VWA domain-containing protein n=1 Tax=Flavobacterium sp. ZT3R18 TaxID=2594429 RepID=UPI00117A4D44|nr:VWA domain-containing protein [Flavobacterium sp. ZT3R18]TRX32198.1 VWA domain-containing protein [Flavobacterium sp. ZT3R18]